MPKSGKLIKAFHYIRLLIVSVFRLKSAVPDIVWVQLPQVPALWAALIYRSLTRKPIKVVADCHNAQLRDPWGSFPLALWSLKRCDAILVHNEAMYAKAAELGWPMGKVLVLEDVPAIGKAQPSVGLATAHITASKPWVLFPGSFAKDEPINEIFEAARLAPELTFIITGRPERAQQNGHALINRPSNLILAGFLSLELFDDLIREADVVLGLTKEEGIQLSVCNEALGFNKPLVTSNTRILKKLFGNAAVLVDTHSPADIVRGCEDAVSDAATYSDKSAALSIERVSNWQRVQLHAMYTLLQLDAN